MIQREYEDRLTNATLLKLYAADPVKGRVYLKQITQERRIRDRNEFLGTLFAFLLVAAFIALLVFAS